MFTRHQRYIRIIIKINSQRYKSAKHLYPLTRFVSPFYAFARTSSRASNPPPVSPLPSTTSVYAKIERVARSPRNYMGEVDPSPPYTYCISRGVFTRDAHDEAASVAVCNYYAEDTLCAQLGCSH